MSDMNVEPQREHRQLAELPDWPSKTIAVLTTVDPAPHAIPVSAPLRAGDHRILLCSAAARRWPGCTGSRG